MVHIVIEPSRDDLMGHRLVHRNIDSVAIAAGEGQADVTIRDNPDQPPL
jgi:hypothetical protein